MTGELNLEFLLRNMQPIVVSGEYVFCTVQEPKLKELMNPLLIFRETEGPTVILKKDIAEKNELAFDSTWGLITLSIHSNLEAVGFLAAITGHLAKAGISVNAVSAFYHDHLLVPYDRIDDAVSLLLALSESSKAK